MATQHSTSVINIDMKFRPFRSFTSILFKLLENRKIHFKRSTGNGEAGSLVGACVNLWQRKIWDDTSDKPFDARNRGRYTFKCDNDFMRF